MTMRRKNYYLPVPLLKQLAARVKKDGLSASEIVRRALEAFLKS